MTAVHKRYDGRLLIDGWQMSKWQMSKPGNKTISKKPAQNANYQVRTSDSPCRNGGERYQDRLIMSQKSKLCHHKW